MYVDDIISALRAIGDYSDEEIERYLPIITINASSIDETQVSGEDYNSVVYYLAAKSNYEICLMRQSDSVTSFEAGDVKISQSLDVNRAKELYELTRQSVADYLADNGFVFMGV